MKTYARIENDLVVELFQTDGDIAQMFHSDLVWVECGGEVHPGWSYNGATFAAPPVPPQPTLGDLKDAKIMFINTEFDRAASALTDGYPEAERLTWPIQQAEALAWAADENVPTPYLDGLAAARGITPAEMRTLTLAQVQAFQVASQQLVGTRQRLRDEINAAETVEDVLVVVWPYAE